jgi:FkbM family methyltransferase
VPLEKTKTAVKSIPFLYGALRPILARYRRRGGEAERLRQYCARVPSLVSQPTFVKVGANDGVTGDPISDLLLADERWKGLLIEPVPFIFERLQKNLGGNRRFVLEQVAIGPNPRKSTFYYVDAKAIERIPNLPLWYDQLGSFDRNHIIRHLDGVLTPFILECTVEVRPLSDVLRTHGIREVHLLQIDVEGYDYEALKTIDLANDPPAAFLIEHKHLSEVDRTDLVNCLRGHNYSVDQCEGDYFAIHKKSPLSGLAKDWALRARHS